MLIWKDLSYPSTTTAPKHQDAVQCYKIAQVSDPKYLFDLILTRFFVIFQHILGTML